MPIITSGKLRFRGQEPIAVAGKSWQADKFELEAHLSPLPRKPLLWVSADGLLLAIEAERESGPKGRLELTRLETRADSPPHVRASHPRQRRELSKWPKMPE